MYPMFTYGWFFHHPHALSTSGGVSEDIESLPSLLSWSPEAWPRSNSQIPRHLMLGMELSGTIIQVHLKWFGGHYTTGLLPTRNNALLWRNPSNLALHLHWHLRSPQKNGSHLINLMTPVIRDVLHIWKNRHPKGPLDGISKSSAGWYPQLQRPLDNRDHHFHQPKTTSQHKPWKTIFQPSHLHSKIIQKSVWRYRHGGNHGSHGGYENWTILTKKPGSWCNTVMNSNCSLAWLCCL